MIELTPPPVRAFLSRENVPEKSETNRRDAVETLWEMRKEEKDSHRIQKDETSQPIRHAAHHWN
jgi:hypothetical protein